MRDLIASYQEFQVILRMQTERKSLLQQTFVDREILEFQITSIDVDHVEMVHVLNEPLPKYNKTVFLQNEYSIRQYGNPKDKSNRRIQVFGQILVC